MKHAGINGSGEQVVGRCDGVDVACQVQVHFLHGYDLPCPRCAQAGPPTSAQARPAGGAKGDYETYAAD